MSASRPTSTGFRDLDREGVQPKLKAGVRGCFATPPEETAFEVNVLREALRLALSRVDCSAASPPGTSLRVMRHTACSSIRSRIGLTFFSIPKEAHAQLRKSSNDGRLGHLSRAVRRRGCGTFRICADSRADRHMVVGDRLRPPPHCLPRTRSLAAAAGRRGPLRTTLWTRSRESRTSLCVAWRLARDDFMRCLRPAGELAAGEDSA